MSKVLELREKGAKAWEAAKAFLGKQKRSGRHDVRRGYGFL